MFFTKFPHPANFDFATSFDSSTGELNFGNRQATMKLEHFEGGLSRLSIEDSAWWPENRSLAPVFPPKAASSGAVKVGKGADLEVSLGKGKPLANGAAGEAVGVSQAACMFRFNLGPDVKFYGLGEKTFNKTELSGVRSRFWNTDVWSDFSWTQWGEHPTDPSYFTTPYVAAQTPNGWVGFLIHNPGQTWIETPGNDSTRVFVEWQRTSPTLILGSEQGQPCLWIITAPSLAELTRKFQKLIGTTPRPPLWSLGYHQSRWGYGGHDDLLELDAKFAEHKVPCSGLWLDLDYMDGYRIFKTAKKMFPKGASVTAKHLAANGRRIVPIIDPGVKSEKGYSVYDEGLKADVFCKNPNGKPYIGLVWPGETVFPDFTQAKARDWWANYVAAFRKEGYGACWVDMNDPSTGPVDPTDMLFNDGKESHGMHRNQYALGMQMATFEGFLKHAPNERPFILSRSGMTGSSQFSAIWTGDNVSNRFYLQVSIPTAIGMALSGHSFNGPDMGGFGGDVTPELMADWVRAGFLMPFCRNHSGLNSRQQEPWALGKRTGEVMRRYIQLRYRLLPYLYQVFIDQEENGNPVLRPLMYDFEAEGYGSVADEFMIGPAILQAPFLDESSVRKVILPGTAPWFDACHGEWVSAGTHEVARLKFGTPLYVREGSIIPMRSGKPEVTETDLRKVAFHLFPHQSDGESVLRYVADDGLSYDYRKGGQTEVFVSMKKKGGVIHLDIDTPNLGYGPVQAQVVIHGADSPVVLNGTSVASEEREFRFAGKTYRVRRLVQ
jgi:alpha-glucosidase